MCFKKCRTNTFVKLSVLLIFYWGCFSRCFLWSDTSCGTSLRGHIVLRKTCFAVRPCELDSLPYPLPLHTPCPLSGMKSSDGQLGPKTKRGEVFIKQFRSGKDGLHPLPWKEKVFMDNLDFRHPKK